MGNFFKALKAGVTGFVEGLHEADQPREYAIGGRPVKCPHCGEKLFIPARALLNSRGMTLLNLDWTDPGATILVCAECSRIEWFAQAPDLDLTKLKELD